MIINGIVIFLKQASHAKTDVYLVVTIQGYKFGYEGNNNWRKYHE